MGPPPDVFTKNVTHQSGFVLRAERVKISHTLYVTFFFQPEVQLQNGEARRTQKRVKKQKTISAFYSSLLTLISVCGVNYRTQRCNRSS